MRILVTGKDGQVGWELRRTLAVLGDVVAVDRTQLDLSNPEQAAGVVRELKPHVIVNAAAYTAVDKAESEEPLARAINALTPGAMALEAKKLGALFVHYSTDYVFDGQATQPYRESDPVAPVSAYGRTKEEGERLIRESGANHLILRTAWVYGVRGKNFLLTMLRLAKERDRLRVVGDQIGSPTWSRLIAEATAALVLKTAEKPVAETLNLTSQGQTSWHGFASAIVATGAELGLCPNIPVDAIGTADYPTPAHRPAYSVLSAENLKSTFDIALPDWKTALELCLDDLKR
ncbi:dTDP-4-dehydrorhamnose reductase [Hydrocarboniphaga sp.]|uniref:dTDP-4-dehydrorhamnose reductase n=1 Tax=Hydrocarboniphaga sp. TaxID=2033016 RepID=UPI002ABAF22A|nr:dTDP-4-dehydrorhamnose reductase [Hydrocarboniphaga sp.]MDZ4078369.1 dTDP-4-dehydrorhamnose reductase [Hydrocarboniphaga sp.]